MSKPADKKEQRVSTKGQTAPPEPVKTGYDVEPVKTGYGVEPPVKVGYDVKGGKGGKGGRKR